MTGSVSEEQRGTVTAADRADGGAGALDCLLIHASKSQTFYGPLNVYQSCNRMTMGLLALAELGERGGFCTRVLHVGIERTLDKRFSLREFLLRNPPRVIGFSLQFHHGIVDTFQLIREAREALPDALIFLGGFTATFFEREILEMIPQVDAVIQGDAEEPFLRMLAASGRTDHTTFQEVPNLAWRRNGDIVENEQSYCTNEARLNDLVFTRFDLLEHAKMYVGMPKAFIRTNLSTGIDVKLNRLLGANRSKVFWGLPVGRGCVSKCFYCGGGARAQWEINRRRGVMFRTPEKVIGTIQSLVDFGFGGSYLSFDPHPWSREYYPRLFELMRSEGILFNLIFSAWGLPEGTFLEDFARTVGPRSSFTISPETGCERLRKLSRALFYTNAELMDALTRADNLGIRTTVFFCVGVPGETQKDFEETIALRDRIRKELKHGKSEAFLIEVEPGAPWHLEPEKYGIRLLRRTLADFVRDHSAPDYSSMTHLGYTSGFFGDADIDPKTFGHKLLKLRCRYFCDRRAVCAALTGAWWMGRNIGLLPKPQAIPGEGR